MKPFLCVKSLSGQTLLFNTEDISLAVLGDSQVRIITTGGEEWTIHPEEKDTIMSFLCQANS